MLKLVIFYCFYFIWLLHYIGTLY